MINIKQVKKLVDLLKNFQKYILKNDLIFYIKIEQLINLSNIIIKTNYSITSFDKYIVNVVSSLNELLLNIKHYNTNLTSTNFLYLLDYYFLYIDKLNYIIKEFDNRLLITCIKNLQIR